MLFEPEAMSLSGWFRKWHQGPFVSYENSPGDLLVRMGGEHKRPALAKALDAVVGFWLRHWKWIIGTAIAVALAIYAKRHAP